MNTFDPSVLPQLSVNAGLSPDTGNSVAAPGQQDFSQWLSLGAPTVALERVESAVPEQPADVVAITTQASTQDLVAGVLYGWQLHTQHSLSQLANGTAQQGEAAASGVRDAAKPVQQETVGDAMTEATREVPVSRRDLRTEGIVPAPMGSAPSARDPAASRNVAAVAAGSASSAPWAERLLRTVELADRSLTVWLRDYRLDESQVPATADEILRIHADGNRISRVVVNGNEVWHRKPLQSRSE